MAKEAPSLFDQLENSNREFIIDFCRHDKTKFCRNWNGKGNIDEVKRDLKCPEGIIPQKPETCRYYSEGGIAGQLDEEAAKAVSLNKIWKEANKETREKDKAKEKKKAGK